MVSLHNSRSGRNLATQDMDPESVKELLLGGDPQVFRWEDDDVALRAAAANSRLPWDRLTAQEIEVFSEVQSDPATQTMYLFIRNKILQMWLLESNVEVTVEQAKEELPSPYNSNIHLVRRIHAFLFRYGYINFGSYYCLNKNELPPSARARKIIVIGAGIAGLAAYKQLKNFGFRVTVLEGRKRVGGRVHTFRDKNGIGELGASAVQGVMGNPLVVLARQVNCQLSKMRDRATIFDDSGKKVHENIEKTSADLYTKLGATAAYIGHVKGITKINGETLSLEDMFDHLMRLIELRQSRRHEQYWKVYEEVLNKKKQLQDEMVLLKKSADESHEKLLEIEKNKRSQDTSDEDLVTEILIKCHRKDIIDAVKKYDECLKKLKNVEAKLSNLKQMENREILIGNQHKQLMDHEFAQLEFSTGTTLKNLSLLHWDQDDPFEMKGSQMTVKNGFNTLVEHLNDKVDVKMGHFVDEIAYDEKGVRVTARVGEQKEVFEADAVVCTLPLGMLKRSIGSETSDSPVPVFNPPLPQQKTDAIKSLGFGSVNKLVLVFDKPFWKEMVGAGPGFFGHVNKSGASRGEFFSFLTSNDTPCLVGLLSGEAAELEVPTHTLIARAMSVLASIFGSIVPKQPVIAGISRWHKDAFTFGAYSYIGKDSDPSMYNLLATPVKYVGADEKDENTNRIYFAGEHTNRNYPATVHGAFLSGVREAARIADLYIGRPFMHNFVPECVTLESDDDMDPNEASTSQEAKGKGNGFAPVATKVEDDEVKIMEAVAQQE